MRKNLRSSHSPFNLDYVINEFFKILCGSIVFFTLYYYCFQDQNDFWSNLNQLMFFNAVATISGFILAYMIVRTLFFRSFQKRTFFDLNTIFDPEKFIYELLLLLINSILGALLVLNILMTEAGGDLIIFFGYWLLYKIALAFFTYFLAHRILKNTLVMAIFLIIFGVLII